MQRGSRATSMWLREKLCLATLLLQDLLKLIFRATSSSPRIKEAAMPTCLLLFDKSTDRGFSILRERELWAFGCAKTSQSFSPG